MTVHRHEVITVRTAADPASIREELIQVPSDACLIGLELDDAVTHAEGAVVRVGIAYLTFEREERR